MWIEMRLLRYITNPSLKLGEVVVHALPAKQNLSFGWLDQAGQHLYCRTLAGSVGSQVSQNLTRLHRETDVPHRRCVLVVFREGSRFQHYDSALRAFNPCFDRISRTRS